jgi:hypothetical protein
MNINDDEIYDENKDSAKRVIILAVLFIVSFAVSYYLLSKFM